MNYQQTVDYLYSQLPVYQNIGGSAYKEGLDNSLQLSDYFDNPHRKYKTIHVAGTNGKGSTSHLLAAILQKSGYKVGLYTSPHLVDFRERIRINGQKIPKQYIVDFVEEHKEKFEPIHPSFFELTMTMAFKYFADEEVDIALVEVGLGGRLDSTNIITPDLSIITNISLDHIQFLGNTLEKIASEKAGIIKYNIPVVIGEAGTVRTVFENKALEVGAPIYFAEDLISISSVRETDNKLMFDSDNYKNLISELIGGFQLKNAATVLTSISILQNIGYTIPKHAVYDGFAKVNQITGFQGRWQVIQANSPKIVCDTGHNVAGVRYVVEQIKKESFDYLHFIIGMVNDKDISHVLELLPNNENVIYYFTQASIARALKADELNSQAKSFGLKGDSYPMVTDAVRAALSSASDKDMIFIGGSNFVVGEALPLFESESEA